MKTIEIKFLKEYWILIALEEVYGFNQALESDKQTVVKSLGYQRYVLQIRVNELAKTIYEKLPKVVRKIFRYRSENEND